MYGVLSSYLVQIGTKIPLVKKGLFHPIFTLLFTLTHFTLQNRIKRG